LTVAQIAEMVKGELIGDGSVVITGVGSLEGASAGELAFVKDERHAPKAVRCKASAFIVPSHISRVKKPQIVCKKPFLAFVQLVTKAVGYGSRPKAGVHRTAVVGTGTKIGKDVSVGANATIGEDCVIGDGTAVFPNVVVGDGVRIGKDCIIHAGVAIREGVAIGNRTIIHSGTVIGADGFGYIQERGRHVKVPQIGGVRIGDDVEIGANVTIDRAALDMTIIGNGVKIDNHSHIAHNVEIGDNSLLIAYARIAGGTKIGKNVIIAEDVGITDNVTIGDGCVIGGGSKVYKSLKNGEVVWGSPAKPIQQEKRIQALIKKLPEMREQLRKLRRKPGEKS